MPSAILRGAMSEENVETLRLAHAAFERGDMETAIESYLHPEIEWETRWPGLPHAYYGRDGVREWFERVMEPIEMKMDLLDVRAVGAQVLASYRAHGAGKSSGVPTEMPIFDLLTFRDGLIARRQTFYTEAEALEAAGQ
jgi:ketosteroid isomerase-like protein